MILAANSEATKKTFPICPNPSSYPRKNAHSDSDLAWCKVPAIT